MDEELKALLEKAEGNLTTLKAKQDADAEKIKTLETKNQELTEKIQSAVDGQISKEDYEVLKNEIADLETKVGKPTVEVKDFDQKALTLAFKNAVGKYVKSARNKAVPELEFKDYIEHEIKAALNLSTTGQGLESIAEVLSREIIERAREAYPILGEVRIRNMPRSLREEVLISYPSVQQGIENVAGSSISETDVQRYGEVTNQVAKINAKPRITREAMVGGDLDIYGHLLDLLDDELGRYLVSQVLFGDGTTKNMRGILSSNRLDITNTTGEAWKPTIGAGARDLDHYPAFATGVANNLPATNISIVDWLLDLTVELPTKYLNGAKWYMNRRTLNRFKKVRDADERPIFMNGYMGEGISLLGYPVVIEDNMPDIAADAPFLIFGALNEAFSMSPGDIDDMLLDPYTVDGCVVVKIDKEYFEIVGKNDAIVIGVATTNGA